MNGAPLPPQHGAPLRLVVPGWYGMAQVKWLTRDRRAHRAVHRLPERDRLPAEGRRRRGRRAGDPDPAAGPAGPARLAGLHDPRAVRARRARCCCPAGPGPAGRRSTRVEVSTDGGALVGRRRAWRRRTRRIRSPGGRGRSRWTARPGAAELLVRATDELGAQPVEQEWNRQGMANNLVQRVPVTVLD